MVVARAAVMKLPLNQASAAGLNIPTAAAPNTHAGNREVARSHLLYQYCIVLRFVIWLEENEKINVCTAGCLRENTRFMNVCCTPSHVRGIYNVHSLCT